MTEALKGIIDFAFNTLHLSSILVDPLSSNEASVKIAERLGGIFEGTKKIQGSSSKVQKVYRISPPTLGGSQEAPMAEERPIKCCRW